MSDFPDLDQFLADSMPPQSSKTTLRCGACDKTFPLNRRWQKFCSDTCRSSFHYKELEQAKVRQVEELEAEIERLSAENAQLKQQLKDAL